MDLDADFQRLIPADFGFHNTLKSDNDSLGFVDFDYFGWDDPVKMAVDFMIHPAHNLSLDERELVKDRLANAVLRDTGFEERLKNHAPLFALRWALILLNPFRKDRIYHRKIDTEEFSRTLKSQLRKAEQFCKYSREFRE